jgi:hypothetical protein
MKVSLVLFLMPWGQFPIPVGGWRGFSSLGSVALWVLVAGIGVVVAVVVHLRRCSARKLGAVVKGSVMRANAKVDFRRWGTWHCGAI